jgi:DNA-binding response OmpR family regulator
MSDKNNCLLNSILLVDSNTLNLQVLGGLLMKENYDLEFAVSGESALEWMKEKQFDLVILSINLPGIDGFETCARISALSKVPVIFISEESERNTILKCFEVGALEYITKPYDRKELLIRIKTQIELKTKTEKLENINKWLSTKIDNWIKVSTGKPINEKNGEQNDRKPDVENNQTYTMKDIVLEMHISIREIKTLLVCGNDPEKDRYCTEIINRMSESINKLEEIAISNHG